MDFSVLPPISGDGLAHLIFCLLWQTAQPHGKRTGSAENRGLSLSQTQSHVHCVQRGQVTTSSGLRFWYLYNGTTCLLI